MLICPGIPADVPAIERIVAGAYGQYIARMGKKPGPMLDDYAAHVAAGHLSVAELDGRVAGLIVLCPEPACLLLDNIATDPALQGSGVGKALLMFAENEALRRGFATLRLYTHVTMVENIALYARSGWRETGCAVQNGYDRVFFEKPVTARCGPAPRD